MRAEQAPCRQDDRTGFNASGLDPQAVPPRDTGDWPSAPSERRRKAFGLRALVTAPRGPAVKQSEIDTGRVRSLRRTLTGVLPADGHVSGYSAMSSQPLAGLKEKSPVAESP